MTAAQTDWVTKSPGMKELGRKLYQLRKRGDLTLRDVSASTGVSPSFLSKVERGITNISVGYLKRLCDFYDLPMIALFELGSDSANLDAENAVIRKGHGTRISFGNVTAEFLSAKNSRKLEPILAYHEPGSQSGAVYTHEGEEFSYVLAGRLVYILGDQEHELGPGDSIHHSSTIPHGWRNPFDVTALILTLVTPPSFLF